MAVFCMAHNLSGSICLRTVQQGSYSYKCLIPPHHTHRHFELVVQRCWGVHQLEVTS